MTTEERVATPQPKIGCVEQGETYSRFVAEPLERGFGVTLGNALRRVLLGCLPGAAIRGIKIEGVQHEYSSLPFMKEDLTDLLLNVKAIRLRPISNKPATLYLNVQREGEVTAADIEPSSDYQVVNPEEHLATLDSQDARLAIEFYVEPGKGYVPATHVTGMPIGNLPVDAIFSPVRKANFTVEHTRVGQVTDYDRLVLEIWTDGTITPMEALRQAAQALVDQFFLFTNFGKALERGPDQKPLALTIPAEVYNTLIEKLGLSARTLNCLKRNNTNKVGEVLEKSREELLSMRNFGEKSLDELYDRLRSMGLLSPEEKPADSKEGAEADSEAVEATS
ncbi:MAG: DNA-directed RNA polymerase subunit alpha [Dehalococcoidia bacterium]|nr:DNA-directed RNA polymerase subunit alpha [Dehalococcoidia bacterium]